jgi:integrase
LLSALFEHARRFGWVVRNQCEFVHAPFYEADVRAFTPKELAALIRHADPDTLLLIEVGAVSGLRESELFGIRFPDIDFQRGGVRVTRQLQNGVALPPKSENSRRFVPLPPTIMKKLSEHPRRFAGHDRHTAGPHRVDGLTDARQPGLGTGDAADVRKARDRSLVFFSPEGHAMNASNFHRRIWKPLLKAAGIELENERGKITFHSLRHAAATAAIASGANVQTVCSLLGHANPQITLTTYADEWAAKLDQNTAVDIANVLFGSKTVAADEKEEIGRAQNLEKSPENLGTWNGGPCRSRTYDQEIKSKNNPLLCNVAGRCVVL